MKREKWTSSDWVVFVVLALIPISIIAQHLLNIHSFNILADHLGTDLDERAIQDLSSMFVSIPIKGILTLAGTAISVIYVRKGAREATTNLSLPIGVNAINQDNFTEGK